MITFVHVSNTANTGDLMSTPRHWFDWPGVFRVMDFRAMPEKLPGAVIVGGGALTGWIAQGGLSHLARPKIAWGVGSTRHGEVLPWPDAALAAGGLDLIGVREWSPEREAAGRWVPCASCMSDLFDDPPAPVRDVVRFLNADPRVRRKYPLGFDDLPTMFNTAPFADIVAFLASASLVVTDSYHGLYWATLLGRGVVCQPYSSKFYGFKHPPTLIEPGQARLPDSVPVYPDALAVCRAANRHFYQRVRVILAGQAS